MPFFTYLTGVSLDKSPETFLSFTSVDIYGRTYSDNLTRKYTTISSESGETYSSLAGNAGTIISGGFETNISYGSGTFTRPSTADIYSATNTLTSIIESRTTRYTSTYTTTGTPSTASSSTSGSTTNTEPNSWIGVNRYVLQTTTTIRSLITGALKYNLSGDTETGYIEGTAILSGTRSIFTKTYSFNIPMVTATNQTKTITDAIPTGISLYSRAGATLSYVVSNNYPAPESIFLIRTTSGSPFHTVIADSASFSSSRIKSIISQSSFTNGTSPTSTQGYTLTYNVFATSSSLSTITRYTRLPQMQTSLKLMRTLTSSYSALITTMLTSSGSASLRDNLGIAGNVYGTFPWTFFRLTTSTYIGYTSSRRWSSSYIYTGLFNTTIASTFYSGASTEAGVTLPPVVVDTATETEAKYIKGGTGGGPIRGEKTYHMQTGKSGNFYTDPSDPSGYLGYSPSDSGGDVFWIANTVSTDKNKYKTSAFENFPYDNFTITDTVHPMALIPYEGTGTITPLNALTTGFLASYTSGSFTQSYSTLGSSLTILQTFRKTGSTSTSSTERSFVYSLTGGGTGVFGNETYINDDTYMYITTEAQDAAWGMQLSLSAPDIHFTQGVLATSAVYNLSGMLVSNNGSMSYVNGSELFAFPVSNSIDDVFADFCITKIVQFPNFNSTSTSNQNLAASAITLYQSQIGL